jgi:ribosomal protein L35
MAVKIGKAGKQRTKTAAKKRIGRTRGGKGKYVSCKCACGHLMLQKKKRQKKKAGKPVILGKGDATRAKRMLSV